MANYLLPSCWFREQSVFSGAIHLIFLILLLDAVTLDILRGIQGIGAAAQVPASVSALRVLPPNESDEPSHNSSAFLPTHSHHLKPVPTHLPLLQQVHLLEAPRDFCLVVS